MIRTTSRRWLVARVTLFFVAAGVWLVGVVFDDEAIRWVAMGIAFVTLLLGIGPRIAAKRQAADSSGADA